MWDMRSLSKYGNRVNRYMDETLCFSRGQSLDQWAVYVIRESDHPKKKDSQL